MTDSRTDGAPVRIEAGHPVMPLAALALTVGTSDSADERTFWAPGHTVWTVDHQPMKSSNPSRC